MNQMIPKEGDKELAESISKKKRRSDWSACLQMKDETISTMRVKKKTIHFVYNIHVHFYYHIVTITIVLEKSMMIPEFMNYLSNVLSLLFFFFIDVNF